MVIDKSVCGLSIHKLFNSFTNFIDLFKQQRTDSKDTLAPQTIKSTLKGRHEIRYTYTCNPSTYNAEIKGFSKLEASLNNIVTFRPA